MHFSQFKTHTGCLVTWTHISPLIRFFQTSTSPSHFENDCWKTAWGTLILPVLIPMKDNLSSPGIKVISAIWNDYSCVFYLNQWEWPFPKAFWILSHFFYSDKNIFLEMLIHPLWCINTSLEMSCLPNANQMTVTLHDTYVSGKYGSLLAYLSNIEKYLQKTIFQKKSPLCTVGNLSLCKAF